jgi:outer membrane protein assembly factor BamB
LRAGLGSAFSGLGEGLSRLDLRSGAPLWSAAIVPEFILRRKDELVLYAEESLLGVDPETGDVLWSRESDGGMRASFIADDLLVGDGPDETNAIDLASFRTVWSIQGDRRLAPVSDGNVVVIADEGIVAYNIRTGAPLWRRQEGDLGGEPRQASCIWRDQLIVRVGGIRSLEVTAGRELWRTPLYQFSCWQVYGDRAYGFTMDGLYLVLDLAAEGQLLLKKDLSQMTIEPPRPTAALQVVRSESEPPWLRATMAVSETHVFLQSAAGQVISFERDTGELHQVLQIGGMPLIEPIIYQNRLLTADFDACVYCFEGAPGSSAVE